MRVAILGAGPAGLMAAHGVMTADSSAFIAIFSKKQKSALHGAQYLHQPIPGMTPVESHLIDYQLRGGDADDYRRKVYGKMWEGSVSPEDLAEPHLGWDIRATYDRLWDTYASDICDTLIDPIALARIVDGGWDLVVNTIPRDMICSRGHTFAATEVIAAGDAPSLGIDIGKMFRCPDNTVICNAAENPSWYRMSRIYGHTTVEWPMMRAKIPVSSASIVRKPTFHACDCWPTVTHVGRYGSWAKGVLSHEAYFKVHDLIKNGASE